MTWQFEDPRAGDDTMIASCKAELAAGALGGHRAFVRDVVAALHGERVPLVDGEEARRSLEIIEAIYESARSRREVTLASARHLAATT